MIEKQIINKIKEYNRIIIHGHIRPDGDCYGSQFGLKSIIKNSFPKKEVYVVGEKSAYVSFVGQIDIIEDSLYENSLAIVVDTATSERISDQRYLKAKETIKIDHHIPLNNYGDLIWVDTVYPACAEMIASLIFKFPKLKMDKEGAMALYVGLVTDTGRFKYSGVSKNTFNIAGKLLDYKIDVTYIDELLSIETIETIKLKGYILNNIKTTVDGFVYAIITKQLIDEYHVSEEEASSMINLLGNIEKYPVWAFFIETKEEVRIRLRSRGPRIDLLANEYSGGGHKMAAGAKIKDLNQILEFAEKVNQLIKEYKRL